jgi:tetratricopeptide (TPR) repeat protein
LPNQEIGRRDGPPDEDRDDLMDVAAAFRLLELAREVYGAKRADPAAAANRELEQRADDIEDAVRALAAAGEAESALELTGDLGVFWQDIGRIGLGRRVTAAALESARQSRTRSAARAQLVLGELAFRQGDQAEARSGSELSREIAAEVGDATTLARAELNLARVAFRAGDAPQIFHHAQRVLEVAGADLQLQSAGIHMLGWAEYTAGNVAAALTHFAENVENYRRLGNRLNEASELANIADLAMETGERELARTRLAAALQIPEAVASRYLVPSLIRSVGVFAGVDGRPEQAVRLIAAAEELYRRYDLTPDPGDELTPRVWSEASAAIGIDRVERITGDLAGASVETFVEWAREELS